MATLEEFEEVFLDVFDVARAHGGEGVGNASGTN